MARTASFDAVITINGVEISTIDDDLESKLDSDMYDEDVSYLDDEEEDVDYYGYDDSVTYQKIRNTKKTFI